MIIGAVVAAGTAAAQANQQKKAAAAAGGGRPKRRGMTKVQGTIMQGISNRQRALVAMAQAHQNFASMW